MDQPNTAQRRRFHALADSLRQVRHDLEFHPLYLRVRDPASLRIFMRTHAFAVWDFMTLAKSLQRHLTCLDLPWLPPADREAARFINEIVLSEESDEVRPGLYMSHFELYRLAMDEEGADGGPIDALIAALRRGPQPSQALASLPIRPSVQAFVRHTLEAAARPAHEVAATFLFGRETVIPGMFTRLYDLGAGRDVPEGRLVRRALSLRRKVTRAAQGSRLLSRVQRDDIPPHAFELYLKRHIELDGGEHGPMGERMLTGLCDRDEARWQAAEAAARLALAARHALWDGVLADIEGR